MLLRKTWNHLTECKLLILRIVTWSYRESLCGGVVNVQNYEILVSEFELRSRYYVHFRTNTLGKDINCLTTPSYSQLWVK